MSAVTRLTKFAACAHHPVSRGQATATLAQSTPRWRTGLRPTPTSSLVLRRTSRAREKVGRRTAYPVRQWRAYHAGGPGNLRVRAAVPPAPGPLAVPPANRAPASGVVAVQWCRRLLPCAGCAPRNGSGRWPRVRVSAVARDPLRRHTAARDAPARHIAVQGGHRRQGRVRSARRPNRRRPWPVWSMSKSGRESSTIAPRHLSRSEADRNPDRMMRHPASKRSRSRQEKPDRTGSITTASGSFQVRGVSPGTWRVRVRASGLMTQTERTPAVRYWSILRRRSGSEGSWTSTARSGGTSGKPLSRALVDKRSAETNATSAPRGGVRAGIRPHLPRPDQACGRRRAPPGRG